MTTSALPAGSPTSPGGIPLPATDVPGAPPAVPA